MRYLLVFILLPTLLLAEKNEKESIAPEGCNHSHSVFTYRDAGILGFIQGATEFIPVSSTGHLLLANHWLGFDKAPLNPSPKESQNFVDLKKALDVYLVVLQLGTIAALVILYWERLVEIFFGIFGLNPRGWRLGYNLLLGFLPAGLLGYWGDGLLQKYLYSSWAVVLALIVGAIFMLLVESWRKSRFPVHGLTVDDLKPKYALTIGFLQAIALWPGMSRSMVTLLGGYLVGLSPKSAAEFSFLLGLVTQVVATGYKILHDGQCMIKALAWGPTAMGCVVAAITALFTIRWLIRYISQHTLCAFAYYRIALALVAIWALR